MKRLEDTAIRCAVIGARAEDGAEVVLTRGAAVDAVLGSASIPVLFPPLPVNSYDFSHARWLIEQAADITGEWIEAGGLSDFSVPMSLRPHTH